MQNLVVVMLFALMPQLNAWGYAAGEPRYPVTAIPPELRIGSDAVVREHVETLTIESRNQARLEVFLATTIFSEEGYEHGVFRAFHDPFTAVRYISGRIYDAQGDLVAKIPKDAISDHAAVSGFSLYDDNRVTYYQPASHDFPYTVEYQYEITYKGYLYLPGWQPVPDLNVGVQKTRFALQAAKDLQIRIDPDGLDEIESLKRTEIDGVRTWTAENLPPVEREPYGPSAQELLPHLYVAPTFIEYDGSTGRIDSWKAFGIWQHALWQSRMELPASETQRLADLTAPFSTFTEKVAAVYADFQSKTRYVSIQLGIGGWQPFPAETVCKKGYGDCKALTNYMLAALQSLDIPACPALVRAGTQAKPIRPDFPSLQFNHVILCVPAGGDTIWLECTSRFSPFGYLGNFTAGRQVLLVTPGGGTLAYTPALGATENIRHSRLRTVLQGDGSGRFTLSARYAGNRHDELSFTGKTDPGELEETAAESIIFKESKIDSVTTETVAGYVPARTTRIFGSAPKIGTQAGTRLMVDLFALQHDFSIPPKVEERKSEFYIRSGFEVRDTVEIVLPRGFEVENLPRSKDLEFTCGFLRVQSEIREGRIEVIANYRLEAGKFPAGDYADYRKLCKEFRRLNRLQAVLKQI